MHTQSKHIQARQQQAQDQKQEVIDLLNWSEQTYCEHQYNCGLAYLYHYIPGDAMGMEFLQRSKIFWNWWKNKWADRDRDFLYQGGGLWKNVKLCTLVELYLQLHDPYELSQDIKPHAVILGASYAKMFQDVIDNEILLPTQEVKKVL